jgi:hypothetical protein
MFMQANRSCAAQLDMNHFSQALAAVATGVALGFLGVGALANGIDAIESRKCPGVTRIQVNHIPFLKDWGTYGVCPRGGLVTPLKP